MKDKRKSKGKGEEERGWMEGVEEGKKGQRMRGWQEGQQEEKKDVRMDYTFFWFRQNYKNDVAVQIHMDLTLINF